ncbi:MAG: RNA polymerase sigma factor WhiG, partial [Chloroflexota bacterium]
VRQQEAELKRAYAVLEGRLGRAATDREVAAYLGMGMDELDQMVANVSRASIYALDEMLDSGDGQVSRMETAEGMRYRTFDEADHAALHDLDLLTLRAQDPGFDALPERERTVISLYYYDEMTFKEIGRILGVTEQRVSQIHNKAVMRLENRMHRYGEVLCAA